MKLNLSELIPLQNELDERIMALHHEERKSTQLKRILALVVEISELANETRSFKYWSLKGPSEKEVLLEEFSDSIHFILSLGIDLGLTELNVESEDKLYDLSRLFLEWTESAIQLMHDFNAKNYQMCADYCAKIAYTLRFNENEVLETYYKKNKKNHNRQDHAY
jgi:dimeric dUTPase (all-alpha-NTP-PPase superfamily)